MIDLAIALVADILDHWSCSTSQKTLRRYRYARLDRQSKPGISSRHLFQA